MYHRDLSSGLRDELLCTSSPLFSPQRAPPVAVLIVAPGQTRTPYTPHRPLMIQGTSDAPGYQAIVLNFLLSAIPSGWFGCVQAVGRVGVCSRAHYACRPTSRPHSTTSSNSTPDRPAAQVHPSQNMEIRLYAHIGVSSIR